MGADDDTPAWLAYLEHTADAGIRVTGASIGELFERAAWGMMSLITNPVTVLTREEEAIEAEADEPEALLVRWLSEINRLHQVHQRVYGQFRVERLDDTRVTGRCTGEAIDFSRHRIFGEIKAVTFHRLRVEQRDGVWVAEVLFDV